VSGPVLAVVPAKPLGAALGRLEGVLDAPARRALQEAMLRDVLRACAGAAALAGALVVTADPAAAALAAEEGARVVGEGPRPRGMNAAVGRGLEAARAEGAAAALVLTADLPLAAPADLDALAGARASGVGVALAPSRDGTGTNGLLLRPPGALRPELGPGSLARHRAQAARRGIRLALRTLPGLALDVDTPEDLDALLGHPAPVGAATEAVRARIGAGVRRPAGVAR
jgi:2-phospho-L-lactate/phosphoenolpyruvate guanylyltransferase